MNKASIILLLSLFTACAHSNMPQRDPQARPPVHVDLTVQGKQLAEAGDYVRAEQYLGGALEAGADVDAVLPSLLRVCVASERYEAALAYAERYEPQARHSAELQLVLAALQISVGQVEAARRSLELVLAHNNDPQAHYLLGDMYYHTLQDYAAADKHYREYLALAPKGRHADNVRRLLLKSPVEAQLDSGTRTDAVMKPVMAPEHTVNEEAQAERPMLVPMPPSNAPAMQGDAP
jgi:tetratricopeptide (TPR) repeat protein